LKRASTATTVRAAKVVFIQCVIDLEPTDARKAA
jgi:hypothetical protein